VTEVAPAVAPKAAGILDDVVVKRPQHSDAKTKKYLCTIKTGTEAAPLEWDHLDLQIRVGPACFGRHSTIWEGEGLDAKLVEIKGMLAVLTDDQLKDVKAKLQFRYARKVYAKKEKDGQRVLIGLADIDSSDGGGINVDPVTRVETPRGPQERPGKTVNGDIPLKDVLDIVSVWEDRHIRGRVISVDEARQVIAAAEEEAKRELEAQGATFGGDPAEEFEKGRGGKSRSNRRTGEPEKTEAEKRAEGALEELSKQAPKAEGAPEVMVREGGSISPGAKGKSIFGGAGRLPEGK